MTARDYAFAIRLLDRNPDPELPAVAARLPAHGEG
jgi:hypothetical protein